MEFLRNVLGERFDEFSLLISDYNKNNPEKSVKLANLADGGYVDKEKYSTLKAKYEKEKERLLGETANVKKTFAIELALNKEKPRNTKALKALLDLDSIIYEDGVLKGLDEQLLTIRKENGFLFEEEKTVPKFTRSVCGAGGELTKDDFKKLSYMEKLKLKKEAPEIYSKLK